MNEIIVQPQKTDMIAVALEKGASPDVISKMIDAQERVMQIEARKAFYAALSAVRGECIKVIKNKKNQHTKNAYADLSAYVDAASPIMAQHGLSHRWNTSTDDNGRITVACIISHFEGHEESTSLSAAPDTGAGRNAVQAIGSTVTYLQRYTFAAMMGLAATDDDGQSASETTAPPPKATPVQLSKLHAALEAAGKSAEGLCKYLGIMSLLEIDQQQYEAAMRSLMKGMK